MCSARRSPRSTGRSRSSIALRSAWRLVNPLHGGAASPLLHGRDRRERRPQAQDQPGGSGSVRAAEPATVVGGAPARAVRPGDRAPSRFPQRKDALPTLVSVDEHPRPDTTLEETRQAETRILQRRPESTVTAGNSSGINDGAAALLIVEAGLAKIAGSSGRSPSSVRAPRPASILGVHGAQDPCPPFAKRFYARIGRTTASTSSS